MKLLTIFFLYLLCCNKVLSQNSLCTNDGNRGRVFVARTIHVETTKPDPVCIRCAAFNSSLQLQEVTVNVTYSVGGKPLENVTGIAITSGGLILTDPAGTFADNTIIVCEFYAGLLGTPQTFTYPISINHVTTFPPTLDPSGGNGRIVNVTEGSDITLTCTRECDNTNGDLYQWIYPDSRISPTPPGDSPVHITLNNIDRMESGVYSCIATRSTIPNKTISYTELTVNVQFISPLTTLESISATETSVTLSWTFGFNGNAGIAGVDISYIAISGINPIHNGSISTDGQQTSTVIANLLPKTTYEFSVRVRNIIDNEVRTSQEESVTAVTLPIQGIRLEVISDPPNSTVTAGQSITLECTTTTGEEPPDIAWRLDYLDSYFIPHNIMINGGHLTVLNATEGDSGNYICYSRVSIRDEVSNSLRLVVLPLSPRTSSSSVDESEGIPVYVQALVPAVFLCVSICLLIINIVQCVWYRRKITGITILQKDKRKDLTIPNESSLVPRGQMQDNWAYGSSQEGITPMENESENQAETGYELYEHIQENDTYIDISH